MGDTEHQRSPNQGSSDSTSLPSMAPDDENGRSLVFNLESKQVPQVGDTHVHTTGPVYNAPVNHYYFHLHFPSSHENTVAFDKPALKTAPSAPSRLFLDSSKIANEVELQRSMKKFSFSAIYEKGELIADGTTGSKIYKCKGKGDGRQYVAKVLDTTFYDVAKAKAEAKFMCECSHQNIVRYFSLCHEIPKTTVCIVMEMCSTSVYDYVKNGKFLNQDGNLLASGANDYFDIDRRKILKDAVTGVLYIHQNGFVHRDLKPNNFLISFNGVVKVANFGFRRKLDTGKLHYSVSRVTESFVAPENYDGRYEKQSDIYVLGLFFYFVLSDGLHPFGDEDEQRYNMRRGNSPNLQLLKNQKTEHHICASSLIEAMLGKEAVWRPTIQEVDKHPTFWKTKKKLNFICDVYGFLYKKQSNQLPELLASIEEYPLRLLKDNDNSIEKFNITKELLPPSVFCLNQRPGVVQCATVKDFVRIIRNKKCHISSEEMDEFGYNPKDGWEKFRAAFLEPVPQLLVRLYEVFWNEEIPNNLDYYPAYNERENIKKQDADDRLNDLSECLVDTAGTSLSCPLEPIIPGNSSLETMKMATLLVRSTEIKLYSSRAQKSNNPEYASHVASLLPDELDLRYSSLLPVDMQNLSYVIQHRATPIKLLSLAYNPIGDDGATHAARCLENIDLLDLTECGITSDGGGYLFSAIRLRPYQLEGIVLKGNNIGDDCAKLVAGCLFNIKSYETSLRSMDLSESAQKIVEPTLRKLQDRDDYEFIQTTSSDVGSEGKALEVGGCIVDIPQNALDRPTTIKLTSYYGKRLNTDKRKETIHFTPRLKCEPNYLRFKKAVSITLPTCFVSKDRQMIVVKESDDGLEWKDVETVYYQNKLEHQFNTTHFTWFEANPVKWISNLWSKNKKIKGELQEPWVAESRTRILYLSVFDDLIGNNWESSTKNRTEVCLNSFQIRPGCTTATLKLEKCPQWIECTETTKEIPDLYGKSHVDHSLPLKQLDPDENRDPDEDIEFKTIITSHDNSIIFGLGSDGEFSINPFLTTPPKNSNVIHKGNINNFSLQDSTIVEYTVGADTMNINKVRQGGNVNVDFTESDLRECTVNTAKGITVSGDQRQTEKNVVQSTWF